MRIPDPLGAQKHDAANRGEHDPDHVLQPFVSGFFTERSAAAMNTG
jgi:hypothetical protein